MRVGILLTTAIATVAGGLPAYAAAGADIRIAGGDSRAATVCGNEASGLDFARQNGIPIQRNDCTATATGGTATLSDVVISISDAAMRRSPGAEALESLRPGNSPAAIETCDPGRARIPGVVQLNMCRATARNGRLRLENVTMVDGPSRRRIARLAIPMGDEPTAECVNRVAQRLRQRDDCSGTTNRTLFDLRGVDVTSSGSSSPRRNINITVQGGRADASIYCFNVTDGSGNVVQVNKCNAEGFGGDVVLRNVTILTG